MISCSASVVCVNVCETCEVAVRWVARLKCVSSSSVTVFLGRCSHKTLTGCSTTPGKPERSRPALSSACFPMRWELMSRQACTLICFPIRESGKLTMQLSYSPHSLCKSSLWRQSRIKIYYSGHSNRKGSSSNSKCTLSGVSAVHRTRCSWDQVTETLLSLHTFVLCIASQLVALMRKYTTCKSCTVHHAPCRRTLQPEPRYSRSAAVPVVQTRRNIKMFHVLHVITYHTLSLTVILALCPLSCLSVCL